MKKTRIAALILGCSLLLAGCESAEQKAENEKNLKQAESNAVNYIEEKYGFTPEITESTLERESGLFGSTALSKAIIRMSYNGKEFSVYIDGSTQNTDGADNYQQDEIISALTEKFSDVSENAKGIVGEIKSININGGVAQDFFPDVEWNTENLYSAYFDGENFAEVFGDKICNITADYIDANFGCLGGGDFRFLLSNERVNLYMISYRTEEDYQERPNYNKFTEYTGIEKHSIQIEESLVFEKGEPEHNEYILGKHDSFYYYASGNSPDVFSFTETAMPDASNWDGSGIIDGEFVTPAYCIDYSVDETLYIYYPLSELPENARLSTYSKTDKGENFRVSPLTADIGDYRMVYIPSSYFDDNAKIYFAFITEKENINEQ